MQKWKKIVEDEIGNTKLFFILRYAFCSSVISSSETESSSWVFAFEPELCPPAAELLAGTVAFIAAVY